MENMQKAIIMAASVLMFVMAVSVAILNYNIVREIIDSILTSSENNSRSAEYFIQGESDTERYATRAEVIMAVNTFADNDYVPYSIEINGYTYMREEYMTELGKEEIEHRLRMISSNKFSVSYDFSNVTEPKIIYTAVS